MEAFEKRYKDWQIPILLFLLLTVRSAAYGFQYWPQLDDYIQYHNYAAQFDFLQLQETVGVLSSRPLAGLADYFIWTPLFEHMIWGVVIISALYVAGAVLAKKLLERYVPVGPVFLVVVVLLPLGVEGTYWMSASTRIVVGFLLACLAAWFFGKWLDSGRWTAAAVYMVLLLLPFGFYEQSAVLAMTLVLGMALLECTGNWKRGLLAFWVFPAAAFYFLATSMLSNGGVYGSRAELMLPWFDGYFELFLPEVLRQVKTVFLEGNFYTLGKGAIRGMQQVLSGELLICAAAAVVLCPLYGLVAARCKASDNKERYCLSFLMGVLLAIAPVTLFLILANPWFSFRGAVTSFVGLALLCDTFVRLIWNWLPGKKAGPAALACLLAFVFTLASATEVGDYKASFEADQRAAQTVHSKIIWEFPDEEERKALRVGVLGLEPNFLPDLNYRWHEHGSSCTESAWAFTGLLVSLNPEETLPSVTPLPTDPVYRNWNAQTNWPGRFDVLYYYSEGEISRVWLEQTGEKQFFLINNCGERIGRFWEESDGLGYFRPQKN